MKTKISYSLLAAAMACGIAFGQTAYTTPVGYETLGVTAGFNYLGLRLQQPVAAAGTFETVGASSLIDTQAAFALSASKLYIVEINDGSGIITEVLGSAAAGTTITTTDNLQAMGVANGASYSIREAATLSSVFGETNSAGLATGFGSIAGADVVFVSDGEGGFDQYYYDELDGWSATTGPVVGGGTAVPIVYTDSLIVSANNPLDLVVSGTVKTQATSIAVASGFSYLSSIYPAGATLQSTFDAAIPTLTTGFGSIAGADVFFVGTSATGFTQYYYDELDGWSTTTGPVVSPVPLSSGVIFSNEGAAFNLKASSPGFYSSL